MKKMTCKDHGTKLVVVERNDGTFWLVMDDCMGGHYEFVTSSWYKAGSWAHEMADNNDQGSKFNHRMCEKFGRTFA